MKSVFKSIKALALTIAILSGICVFAPSEAKAASSYVSVAESRRYAYNTSSGYVDVTVKKPKLTFGTTDAYNANAIISSEYNKFFSDMEKCKNSKTHPKYYIQKDYWSNQYYNMMSLIIRTKTYNPVKNSTYTQYSTYNFEIYSGKRMYNSDLTYWYNTNWCNVENTVKSEIKKKMKGYAQSSINQALGSSYMNQITLYIGADDSLNAAFPVWTIGYSTVSVVRLSPSSVKLNRGTLGLGVGEKYTMLATINPSTAKTDGWWTTTNMYVADINGYGTVTGKKSGTATVGYKTYNNKTASCKVTVKPAPKSIKINTPKLKMGAGENVYIKETTNKGSYANAANLKWTSSNSSVAGVAKIEKTNQAVVYSQYTGNATIKVKTYNGKTSSCGVTVYPMPRSVKLSKYSITLKKGQSYTISETTNKGSYAHPSNISWVSYNSKVATVKKGSGNKATIKAVGKGKTTVAVGLYNRLIAECTVTVK